jgi:tetratricopeptide (TPR) repeat protein
VRAALILLLLAGTAAAEHGHGDALFAAKQYRAAAAAYRADLADDPDDVEARYRLGVALAASGDLVEASQAWQSVLALEPGHARARRNLELARLRDGAGAELEDPVLLVPYLRALIGQGRAASALAVLDRQAAEERNPAIAVDLLAMRGEIDLALGDPAAAAEDFARLLLVMPRAVRPYRGLAEAYRAAGATERASYFDRLSRAASGTR